MFEKIVKEEEGVERRRKKKSSDIKYTTVSFLNFLHSLFTFSRNETCICNSRLCQLDDFNEHMVGQDGLLIKATPLFLTI